MKATILLIFLMFFYTLNLNAQSDKKTFEIYGFVMTDILYNVKTVDPLWYDGQRPTKLPSYDGEFAPDGKLVFSVRQTKLGVKSSMPTSLGEFKTRFDFDLYGTGDNAGQTTLRLRDAYGQLGHFGAGKTNSVFMDAAVYPNLWESWGPPGLIFSRNLQIRYMPLMDRNNDFMIALENPGGSADEGIYADRIELKTVKPHFQLPDFTTHYKYSDDWGYVQLGGILGSLKWTDINDTAIYKLSGDAVRWGASLSSSINLGKKAVLRLMGAYGEGIGNYMNDIPADIGPQKNPGNTVQPVKGVALPVIGIIFFLDVNWSKQFKSTIGYSANKVSNSDGQEPTAYKQGQYAAVNLLYYPVENFMAGIEFIYIRRDNYDGFFSDNPQLHLTFKYDFSKLFEF
jgi:hypothetical protein